MAIEIEIPDNKYGIRKIVLSVEEKTVGLSVKADDDPTGMNLAKNLLSQKTARVDEGDYEPNSFNVKLPKSNYILMRGDLENIVDLLEKTQAVSVEISKQLKDHIKPISFQAKLPISDFFSEKSEDEGTSLENRVQELIGSFRDEDRQKALMLFKLAGELAPETRRALQQKLSAQTTPGRASTPTRS